MDSEPEIIRTLLVGDEKCGKTTFLSYVKSISYSPAHHPLKLPVSNTQPLPISRLSAGEDTNPIPILRDMDQPFIFEIKLGKKQYRLEFYDTSCPDNWRTLDPDVVTICYDISQRLSMINMQRYVGSTHPRQSSRPGSLTDGSGSTKSRLHSNGSMPSLS